MGVRSKSTIGIIAACAAAMLLFLVGGFVIHRNNTQSFAQEGYVLDTVQEEEGGVSGTQIWFSEGSRWNRTGVDQVSFHDAQGSRTELAEDSFVHYADGSVAAFTDSVLSDMDEYADGKILQYRINTGMVLSSTDQYEYELPGAAEDQKTSLSNLIWKAGDLSYLVCSPMLELKFGDGSRTATSTGYVELRYLESNLSTVAISDGTQAWQVLTQGATLTLQNGVILDLSTADIYSDADAQEASTAQVTGEAVTSGASRNGHLNLLNDFQTNSQENISLSTPIISIPKFNFLVINGEDGEDGNLGTDGMDGEAGEAGEAGTEGEAGADGTTGNTGSTSGASGLWGYDGKDNEDTPNESLEKDAIPVVEVKNWALNATSLNFTLYMDPSYADNIVMDTTRVSIIDVNTGEEIYWWNSEGDKDNNGEQIDFFLEKADGYQLHCPSLELNHTYRLVVSADCTLNGVTSSQIFIDRAFTTDNYGISCELTGRTADSLSVVVRSTNERVKIIEGQIELSISGQDLPRGEVSNADEMKAGETFNILMGNNVFRGENIHFSNRYYDVTYKIPIQILTVDEAGNSAWQTVEPLTYTYTYKTLKEVPTVGGISLTPYNEGYFMAKLQGKFDRVQIGDDGAAYAYHYDDVSDPDDAISQVEFDLYEYTDDMNNLGDPVATETADAGFAAYFQTSAIKDYDPAKTYVVKAYYVFNDGEKAFRLAATESYSSNGSKTYNDLLLTKEKHTNGKNAWAAARLAYTVSSSISFEGDPTRKNSTQDTTPGTLYNAIYGDLIIQSENEIVCSPNYPVDLIVSGTPDYYRTVSFVSLEGADANGKHYLTETSTESENSAQEVRINLTNLSTKFNGLLADTAYNFAVYGYVKDAAGNYTRTALGSVVVRTDADKNVLLGMTTNIGNVSNRLEYLGIDFALGTSSYSNAYNVETYPNTAPDYNSKIATAYKSMTGLEFYLYRINSEGATVCEGVCRITDTNTSDPEQNDLYDSFYGKNALTTKNNLRSEGYYGMVGVGSNFKYQFVNPQTSAPVSPLDLRSSTYYITAEVSYDYTHERVRDKSTYNYYSYAYDTDFYINYLTINGKLADEIEPTVVGSNCVAKQIQSNVYPVPSQIVDENGNYTEASMLTNVEAASDSLAGEGQTLYDTSGIDRGTHVGMELSTKYTNDEGHNTQYFIYYGFSWSEYEDVSDTAKLINKDNYGLRFKMDVSKTIEIPKVRLLMYDPENDDTLAQINALVTARKLQKISESAIADGDMGYDYYCQNADGSYTLYIPTKAGQHPVTDVDGTPKTDADGNPVMKDDFSLKRGNSYAFAFETELSSTVKWKYTDDLEDQEGIFRYPSSYYVSNADESEIKDEYKAWKEANPDATEDTRHAYLDSLANAKKYALCSGKVTLNRQKPVSYAQLVKTDAGSISTGGTDTWKILISDPDGALLPESLLGLADSTAKKGDAGIWEGTQAATSPTVTTADGTEEYLTLTAQDKSIKANDKYYTYIGGGTVQTDADGKPVPDPTTAAALKTIVNTMSSAEGGTVTVEYLRSAGMHYQVQMAYCLDDDTTGTNQYGMLTLMEHSWTGLRDYSSYAVPEAAENNGSNGMEVEQYLGTDQDTIVCILGVPKDIKDAAKAALSGEDESGNPTDEQYREYYKTNYYGKDIYKDFVNRIAGVKITAKVTPQGSSKAEYLLDRNADGSLMENTPKEIWVYPTQLGATETDPGGYTDKIRHTFKFNISDFDAAPDTATQWVPQYSAGDKIRFTYTFYYVDGTGVGYEGLPAETGSAYSDQYYALKYVSGNYRLLNDSSANQIEVSAGSSESAARSLLRLKGHENTSRLPWTQYLYVESTVFCKNRDNSIPLSTGLNMYGESYNYANSITTGQPMHEVLRLSELHVSGEAQSVQSASPILQQITTTSGISQVSAKAYIKNYNLLSSTPEEPAHLYYLVFEKPADADFDPEYPGEVVGAAIGSSLKAGLGWIDLKWTIGRNRQYVMVPYYKTTDADGTLKTDKQLFGTGLEINKLYLMDKTEDKSKVEQISKAILTITTTGGADAGTTTDPDTEETTTTTTVTVNEPFSRVRSSNEKYIPLTTDSYLHVDAVEFTLGQEGSYDSKKLKGEFQIEEDVNTDEESRLQMFYTLERSPIGKNEWTAVISDGRNPDNGMMTGTDASYTVASGQYTRGTDYYRLVTDTDGTKRYVRIQVGDYQTGTSIGDGWYEAAYTQATGKFNRNTVYYVLRDGSYVQAVAGDYVIGQNISENVDWYAKAEGTYQKGTIYYIVTNDQYKKLTVGDYIQDQEVPTGEYYEAQADATGKVTYVQTTDTRFQQDKIYYKKNTSADGDTYVKATVGDYFVGMNIPESIESTWIACKVTGGTFADGGSYYQAGTGNTLVQKTAGDYVVGADIPKNGNFYTITYNKIQTGGTFAADKDYYLLEDGTYRKGEAGEEAYNTPISTGSVYTHAAGRFWEYYQNGQYSELSDVLQSQTYDNRRSNTLEFHYLPGGQIVPGYEYRMSASVYYQEEDGTWVNCTAAPENTAAPTVADRRAVTGAVSWYSAQTDDNNVMDSMFRTIQQPGKTEDGIPYLDFRFSYPDNTGTSPTGKYQIRLVKIEADGTETILETDAVYQNGDQTKNTFYQMGQTYQIRFTGLEKDSNYRLRVYGLMDYNYNNMVSIRNNDENKTLTDDYKDMTILDLSKYYPRSNSENKSADATLAGTLSQYQKLYEYFLNAAKAGEQFDDKASNVALADSSIVHTLSDTQSYDIGTYTTVFERKATTVGKPEGNLTLYFEGSYQCKEQNSPVRSCEWTLVSQNQGVTYGAKCSGTVQAADSASLFTYDENTGRIGLTIPKLAFTYTVNNEDTTTEEKSINLMDLTGTYILQLKFSDGAAVPETQDYTIELAFINTND